MTESYIKNNFPKGYLYLKECEGILRGRENGRFDNDEWFQFGRKQGIGFGNQMKLLSPDISLGGNYSGELSPITTNMSDTDKLAIIQREFDRLYGPHHPVRNNLETLGSVDVVRTIREALKR